MHVIILCFSFLFTLARVARVSRLREQVQGTMKKRAIKKGAEKMEKKRGGKKKSRFVDNDFGRTSWSVDLAVATPSWANWTHGTFIYFALKPL